VVALALVCFASTSLASGCGIRFTVSEASSNAMPSGSATAIGLTLNTAYVGSPMYFSGSLFMAFPLTAGTGLCELPTTYEELLASLPSASLTRPAGLNPVTVWPQSFAFEVLGNQNIMSDTTLAFEATPGEVSVAFAPGDATTWTPAELVPEIGHAFVQVIVAEAFKDISADINQTVTDVVGTAESPSFSIQQGNDGAVVMVGTALLKFLVTEGEESGANLKMNLNLTINATAVLGCSACGTNARCSLDDGQPVCECSCGWAGQSCSDPVPCPEFRDGESAAVPCQPTNGNGGSSAPPTSNPAPAQRDGQCMDTQMPQGWEEAEGAGGGCQASGCECMPGFSGIDCKICSNNEACQVWAARHGIPGGAEATCNTAYEYPDFQSAHTMKVVECIPNAPEIASQLGGILVSCWTNTTLNGTFVPPPGLEVQPTAPSPNSLSPWKRTRKG